MGKIILFIFIVGSFALYVRYRLDKVKVHDLYLKLDAYGAILVFDLDGLVAILYKSRYIDWQRSTSMYKMIKIKEISDRFEEEVDKLNKQEL